VPIDDRRGSPLVTRHPLGDEGAIHGRVIGLLGMNHMHLSIRRSRRAIVKAALPH
jgi:hypothetical protein